MPIACPAPIHHYHGTISLGNLRLEVSSLFQVSRAFVPGGTDHTAVAWVGESQMSARLKGGGDCSWSEDAAAWAAGSGGGGGGGGGGLEEGPRYTPAAEGCHTQSCFPRSIANIITHLRRNLTTNKENFSHCLLRHSSACGRGFMCFVLEPCMLTGSKNKNNTSTTIG